MNKAAYALAFYLWLTEVCKKEPHLFQVTGLMDIPEEDREITFDELSLQMAEEFDRHFNVALTTLGKIYADSISNNPGSIPPDAELVPNT